MFIFNTVSANVTIQVINDDLSVGELFVGRLDLDLKSGLDKSDVKVFEGRRYLFSAEGLTRYNNSIFFYMAFPMNGTFNIVIEDLLYSKNSSLFQTDINQTVSIGALNDESLAISPGIIFGSNPFFYLTNNGVSDLEVSFQGNKVSIEPNKSQKVEVSPSNELGFVEVSSYRTFKIPLIPFNLSKQENSTVINETNTTIKNTTEEQTSFEVLPDKIFQNATTNESVLITVSLKNNLNETINISVDSDFSKISFNKSIELSPLSKHDFSFRFVSENPAIFNKTLTFSFNGTAVKIPLMFYVLDSDTEVGYTSNNSANSTKVSCEDIGGEICLVNQECLFPGKVRFLDGFCCVGGQCKDSSEISTSSGGSSFFGILFVIIAGLIIFFLYKKFKSVKPSSKI